MADFIKNKTIKYLNRDFDGFKRDLIEFSQAHHSGVFQDFNETSPGMMLLELSAFIGDNLSFYIDQAFSEIKQETARQKKNVVGFAKSLGYRPKGNRASRGELHFIVEVPSTTNGIGETVPDDSYSPILLKGSKAQGPNGVIFETLEDIVFSASLGREVTGSQFDATTGLPTHFALRKSVEVISGETKTDTTAIGSFEQFKTIELSQDDVLEVLDVTDSDGNKWSEVRYLAEDTVFDSDVNSNSDSNVVPYVLKLVTVPRRFITDYDPETNKTSLIFGQGDGVNFDDELIPNLADLSLPLAGRTNFTSFALDPQNFLKTRSLGLSPFNTTLTINYRVGGGVQSKVPPKSIKTVVAANFAFNSTSLNSTTKSNVVSSIECINLKNIDGGAGPETLSEIKANSSAFFAAQDRVVTKEDMISRVLTLPSKFGKPDKVFVKKNNVNSLATDLYVLTRDENGHFTTATTTLKNNIKTYLSKYRMLTDGINILDGQVINLRCNFGVVVSPLYNRSEVRTKCLSIIKDYLDNDTQQIAQPIVLSDLSAELQGVLGVISVYELRFSNIIGLTDGLEYSSTRFDVKSQTANNIIYCPGNSIFEVKHPRKDIVGVAK